MFPELESVLIDRERIATRVAELGDQIARDAVSERDDGGLVLVPILTGALVFTADLIRRMPVKLSLRVVAVSSYPGTSMVSKGAKIRSELPLDLCGRRVLIVDDILDSGQTLGLVRELVEQQGAADVRVCVLLRKPMSVRKRDVRAEYVGFDIPDRFVVGYGLDYDGYYRNIPEIAVLRAEAVVGAAPSPGGGGS